MADATFNGETLIIRLPPGETEVDVSVDLYSAWKRFQLVDKRNMRFPPAFRTIGGDDLTPGVVAGAYFFLQNDLGWRIQPAEEHATVNITGNLAPEDSALSMTVPTDGAFTVLLNGIQPITQAVDELLLLQQDAFYQGTVHIDTDNGSAGTVFPIGTASDPVLTVADAIVIATNLNIRSFTVTGQIILTQTYRFWEFIGKGAHTHIDIDGQDVSGSRFERVSIEGAMTTPVHEVWVIDSEIESAGILNFKGTLVGCYFAGNMSVAGATTVIRCASNVPGVETPVFDTQNLPAPLSIRGWVGGLKIVNFSQPGNNCSVDLGSGHLILDPTVSDGTIVVRGVGHLTDNSTGSAVVVKDGMIDGRELELVTQITAGNVTVSLDDGTITVFEEDGVTPIATYSVSPDKRIRIRTS